MLEILGGVFSSLAVMAKRTRTGNSLDADLAAIQQLHETDMAAAKIHDIHTLITLITGDCILLSPGYEPIRGRDAIWKFMQKQLPESQKYEITEYIQINSWFCTWREKTIF